MLAVMFSLFHLLTLTSKFYIDLDDLEIPILMKSANVRWIQINGKDVWEETRVYGGLRSDNLCSNSKRLSTFEPE